MRVLRELRKVYGVAHPTRKTLQDSNYELPASRGLTCVYAVEPHHIYLPSKDSKQINLLVSKCKSNREE